MPGAPVIPEVERTTEAPTLFGVPVDLPRLGDVRLRVAGIVLSLHALGQIAFDFRVSVPQIAAAIGAGAVFDLVRVFVTRRRITWPASAMLTGSGIGLIMGLGDMEPGRHWSTDRWWVYAAATVAALMAKQLIRHRGTHVFNPSNLVLVVVFVASAVLIEPGAIEPLDLWWGGFGPGLVLAYGLILIGGYRINRRLGLLDLLGAYVVTLVVAVGPAAVAGHCITADWATEPICDLDYVTLVLTSPETWVFILFMLSDPKTVPTTRPGRLFFGVAVAAVSAVLVAPQTTEFGVKVALLGGLTLVAAARWALMARWPRPRWPEEYWMGVIALILLTPTAALFAGRNAQEIDPDTGQGRARVETVGTIGSTAD